MCGGILGYAAFSVAAFVYAVLGEPEWTASLVVAGGAVNGFGDSSGASHASDIYRL